VEPRSSKAAKDRRWPRCEQRFDAFDGPQKCGRPQGHSGTHALEPIGNERFKLMTHEEYIEEMADAQSY
jgi:hypothetical protein